MANLKKVVSELFNRVHLTSSADGTSSGHDGHSQVAVTLAFGRFLFNLSSWNGMESIIMSSSNRFR